MRDEYGRIWPTPRPVPHQTKKNEETVRSLIREIRETHPVSAYPAEFVIAYVRQLENATRAFDIPTLLKWAREE